MCEMPSIDNYRCLQRSVNDVWLTFTTALPPAEQLFGNFPYIPTLTTAACLICRANSPTRCDKLRNLNVTKVVDD